MDLPTKKRTSSRKTTTASAVSSTSTSTPALPSVPETTELPSSSGSPIRTHSEASSLSSSSASGSSSILSRLHGKKKTVSSSKSPSSNQTSAPQLATESSAVSTVVAEDDEPKKRGRKPKDRHYDTFISTASSSIDDIEDHENIIIHLPIKPKLVKPSIHETAIHLETEETRSEPTGIQTSHMDCLQFISQDHNINHTELTGKGPPPTSDYCSYPFDEKQKNMFEMIDSASTSLQLVEGGDQGGDEGETQGTATASASGDDTRPRLRMRVVSDGSMENAVEALKREREDAMSLYHDAKHAFSMKQNTERCLSQFDECNRTESWSETTNIYCWWDCHPFDTTPCGLPCEYKDGKVRVLGVFCSPECAAAYNFNEPDSGYDVWERYNLLNYVYRKVYQDPTIRIKIAAPRASLRIFGGSLTIREFRMNNMNMTHTYKVVMPPMISIIPLLEQSQLERGYSSKLDKKNSATIHSGAGIGGGINTLLSGGTGSGNVSGVGSYDSNPSLKLKRNKPLHSSGNTLERCMLLT